MFTQKVIDSIDQQHFRVLVTSPFAVTLESVSTGHQWHLIAKGESTVMFCEVYHRHSQSDPWHRQWNSKKFPSVLNLIKEHDAYQMEKNAAREARIAAKRSAE